MGCSPEPQVAFAPDPIRSMSCPGRDHAFVQSRCGRYYPDASQPAIYISFAILTPQRQAAVPAETLSPVMYFSGGPGEGGNTLEAKLDHWRYWLLDAGIKRPLILWDSRGNEGAWGYFQCNAYRLWALNRLRYPEHAQDDELLRVNACLEQWRSQLGHSGFDQFSAQQSAQDAIALLLQLGYVQWHFMATSYGSRVAQVATAIEPERTQSLLLDSPYSWAIDSRAAHGKRWRASFKAVLAWCQAREDCHQGELVESLFWRAISALDGSAINVRFRFEGYHHQASIDANSFAHILFSAFYRADTLNAEGAINTDVRQYGQLVPLLKQVIKGEAQLLQDLAAPVLKQSYSSAANPWLYWLTECNDNHVLSIEDYRASIKGLGGWARFLAPDMSLLICLQEGVVAKHQRVNLTGTQVAAPTVILVGELDPVVAREDVNAIADSLRSGVVVGGRGKGHGLLAEDVCEATWLPLFWSAPSAFVGGWKAKLDASPNAEPAGISFPGLRASDSPCELLL